MVQYVKALVIKPDSMNFGLPDEKGRKKKVPKHK